MPAYAIFIKEKTRDTNELDAYSSLAGASFEGREFRVLTAYGPQTVLEGPECEGVVILEFPSVEAAEDWYLSPAYSAARAHRFKGADYRVVIVEGV